MPQVRVIGEIGGSSSRWAILQDDRPAVFLPAKGVVLPGYNPLAGDAELFLQALRSHFEAECPLALEADEVFAYGAGCGAPERKALMHQALSGLWSDSSIVVESDLLAAARGLQTGEAAMVLILGTGMNAGYWDAGHLFQPMPSLGWVLGDEGSGADIGKALLQDAFHHRMPEELRVALFGQDGPKAPEVLQRIHGSAFPSRELAAYTGLLKEHVGEAYVRDLLRSRFHALVEVLELHFTAEQRASVLATGSVAWGFREVLAECLLDRGMSLKAVQRDPLPGLVHHHRRTADRSPGPATSASGA